ARQLQLDIYGEFLDSLFMLDQAGVMFGDAGWTDVVEMVDWLCDNWDQPDEGIWETRGGRQAFVYGRLMCWVAFDRAIRMAAETGARAAATDTGPEVPYKINEQIAGRGMSY